MSRQDGGTHDYWPPGRASHLKGIKGSLRPCLALVAALFLLPACSGPMGTAMAGLFGAGAMYGGQSFLERGQEDVEAKREWRVKKREYVTAFANGMEFEAETHKRAGRFEDWRQVMTQLLAFWNTQHPETLVMELRRRVADKGVVPEPRMMLPPG